MFSVRQIAALALVFAQLPAALAAQADISALNGTMVSPAIRQAMSPQGLSEMEKARGRVLNEDSEQEISWQDPQADLAGSFHISSRKFVQNSSVRCREYIHALVKKSGGPILSERTGKPLKIRDTVCFQNGRWERFKGDASTLAMEGANTNEPATSSTASDAIAPSGPTGPEHRLQHPNMVGPQALGQILDGFKLFKKNIAAQDGDERKELVREQLYGWVGQISEQMAKNNKTISIDQLAILLNEVEKDSVKLRVIQGFKARLDSSVGSAKAISSQFSGKSKRSEAERLLK